MRFIGDIHGKISDYLKIINECDNSIQVGDFGYGFVDIPEISINHRFIRGNHDNPELCAKSPNWIADGTFEDDILYIGGALSVDRYMRTDGVDWWHDEELTIKEVDNIIDLAILNQPKIIVSHDCPSRVINEFKLKNNEPSRTNQAFNALFFHVKPELWIFGHHHRNFRQNIDGTEFICLPELGFIDI